MELQGFGRPCGAWSNRAELSARVGGIFSSWGIFGGRPTGETWPALPLNWSCVKFAIEIRASELDLPSFLIECVGLAAPRPSFSSPRFFFALPTPTRPGRFSNEGLMGMLAFLLRGQ